MKICKTCGQEKLETEFTQKKNVCKPCRSENRKLNYQAQDAKKNKAANKQKADATKRTKPKSLYETVAYFMEFEDEEDENEEKELNARQGRKMKTCTEAVVGMKRELRGHFRVTPTEMGNRVCFNRVSCWRKSEFSAKLQKHLAEK